MGSPRIESAGLLLLTGGKGQRLGGTKHDRPHPSGGSWGGHLVAVHQAVFGDAPVCVLGAPLPDQPDRSGMRAVRPSTRDLPLASPG